MTLANIAWIIACVGVAAFAQSLAGFGFGLLAVPMMQLAISPRDAIVISTVIGAFSTTTQAFLDRQHVERAAVKRLTIASYLGMPFGLLLFILVSDTSLRITLGVVVIVAALILSRGFALPEGKHGFDWLMGFLSGVLSTSTSTNGPPLVFVLQARGLSPEVFRSTINTVFSFANIGALALFVASGKLNAHALIAALLALPALLISLKIGYSLRPKISAEFFRKLVLVMLVLSGASLLVKALV